MSIFISAGHSNTDSGAVNGTQTEANVVRDMRNMVAHYLREAKVNFRTDGTGLTNLPLKEAGRLAAKAGVTL